MHHKRRLLIALAMTVASPSASAPWHAPAGAVPRTFELTLLGNIKRTITIDIEADTPLDKIKLPGLKLPLLEHHRGPVETDDVQRVSADRDQAHRARERRVRSGAHPAPPPKGSPRSSRTCTKATKKKGKPSIGQPVFDSAGRLLSTPLPERARPRRPGCAIPMASRP